MLKIYLNLIYFRYRLSNFNHQKNKLNKMSFIQEGKSHLKENEFGVHDTFNYG